MTPPPKRTPWQAFWYRRRREWVILRRYSPGQIQFWFIALVLGIVAGYAALGFRIAVTEAQALFYGVDDVTSSPVAWLRVLLLPILGGLAVGIILHRFTPDGRARSVAHVIEGAALKNGRVERRTGRASVIASLITLSTGGSTGREGPVVHLGAAISTWVSNRIRADGMTARDLMGCAVAAAVAASFNAPIAGTIFALEVILRHFAVHAFAPIAIASVAGAVVGRIHMGNVTEFAIPAQMLGFYEELPAFMILGLISGFVAVIMMRGIFMTEDFADRVWARFALPGWLRPAVAGALLGLIALKFPHIIGVGYETITEALSGKLMFWTAFSYAVVKAAAVAITIGGRMGGGVFSPALMMGALTGLAFGQIATTIFPDVSGTQTVYALAGMAALASAVLGAPISTTLIAFELTGDWQVGIAVLVSVSLATILSSRLVSGSYFLTQLARRGVHLAQGPQAYLLSTLPVSEVMRHATKGEHITVPDDAATITRDTTLEHAFPQLAGATGGVLYVMDGTAKDCTCVGRLSHLDALKAYNSALEQVAREEHS